MIKVSGNDIYLTRGDTFKAQVVMKDANGDTYTPVAGDVVRFAMKRTREDRTPLLNITIPNDTMMLSIYPEDTHELEFGQYIYDIEITTASGIVDTFIADAKFNLTTEVH